MAYAGYGDEHLIDREFLFAFRKDAWDVEQRLLEHFDRQRAFGKFSNDPAMPLAGRGQSELFRTDVLGLDDECYPVPSNELLKVIQAEQEQAKDGCLMIVIGLVLAPFTLGTSLLFIAGGASGIFSYGKRPDKVRSRPVHPRDIEDLVAALKAAVHGPDPKPEEGSA